MQVKIFHQKSPEKFLSLLQQLVEKSMKKMRQKMYDNAILFREGVLKLKEKLTPHFFIIMIFIKKNLFCQIIVY